MKNTLKVSGIFQIVVGSGMIGIWIVSFLKGTVPEIQTEPMRISMHFLAEMATATLLLVSGFTILLRKRLRETLFHISFGALFYTLIVSPGYFAQHDQWGTVTLFLVLLIISVLVEILLQKGGVS